MWLWIIIGIVVLGIVLFWLFQTKCDSCGKWLALQELNRQEVGRRPTTKKVTET